MQDRPVERGQPSPSAIRIPAYGRANRHSADPRREPVRRGSAERQHGAPATVRFGLWSLPPRILTQKRAARR